MKSSSSRFDTDSAVDEGEQPTTSFGMNACSEAGTFTSDAAAGDNSGEAIRDQMRNIANPEGTEVTPDNFVEGVRMAANGEEINYQGASSTVNFDENGDPASAAYAIWEFDGDATADIEVQNFEGGQNPQGDGPSADEMPGSSDERTIDVGILLPETGNLASVGEGMINAAELPAIQVNDSDLSP